MLSLSEILALLERASELNKQRRFREIAQLLGSLARKDLLAEPELAFLQAKAWYMTGREGAALEFVRDVQHAAQLRGNDALYRRSRNLEGVLLIEQGDLPQAEAILQQLMAVASNASDSSLVAQVANNLGAIATLRGRWNVALSVYGRAVVACTQAGDQMMLLRCHHNLAMTYRNLGYLSKAETHFGMALTYARSVGTEEELTFVEFERALLIQMLGDVALAEISARRALERAVRLSNLRLEGEALRVLGTIFSNAGRWEEARRFLQDALRIAVETTTRLLEAETREELAVVEWLSGKSDSASQHADAAVKLYMQMGAATYASRVLRRLLGASADQIAV